MICLQTAPTDIDLWNAFKQGNKESFAILFRRFYPLLIQYGSKLCADVNQVEDAIQELFFDLWQRRSDIQVHSVKAYLLKALKYKIFKTHRDKISTRLIQVSDEMMFEISHENFLIKKNDDEQRSARIIDALTQLSNRQREVIYLKLFQGLTYEELTEVMQINYQVTRNLFYEAIKSLRKALS
jgi:RNA polymerase sigma-70 factor (ECF subfamily)